MNEVNITFLTLIAKCDNPSSISDFRSISCCNVIYKCITKNIATRMKFVLKGLVSSNQSAFYIWKIYPRQLAHEIVRNYYHKTKGSPRCALKIDLQKTYDTVSWEAIRAAMEKFGFLSKFIEWIIVCISSSRFSVMVNGSPYVFFWSSYRNKTRVSFVIILVCDGDGSS